MRLLIRVMCDEATDRDLRMTLMMSMMVMVVLLMIRWGR